MTQAEAGTEKHSSDMPEYLQLRIVEVVMQYHWLSPATFAGPKEIVLGLSRH